MSFVAVSSASSAYVHELFQKVQKIEAVVFAAVLEVLFHGAGFHVFGKFVQILFREHAHSSKIAAPNHL